MKHWIYCEDDILREALCEPLKTITKVDHIYHCIPEKVQNLDKVFVVLDSKDCYTRIPRDFKYRHYMWWYDNELSDVLEFFIYDGVDSNGTLKLTHITEYVLNNPDGLCVALNRKQYEISNFEKSHKKTKENLDKTKSKSRSLFLLNQMLKVK